MSIIVITPSLDTRNLTLHLAWLCFVFSLLYYYNIIKIKSHSPAAILDLRQQFRERKIFNSNFLHKFLRELWFSWGIAHSGKSLISIFQEFSSSIGKAFILAGGLGAGLSFCGVWTVSWYFLIS